MKFIKKALITVLATLSMGPFCALKADFINHTLKLVAKNKTIFVLHVVRCYDRQGVTPRQIAQIARTKKAPVFLSCQDNFFKEIEASCKNENVYCSKLTEFLGNKKTDGASFVIVPANQYTFVVPTLGNDFYQKDSFRSQDSSQKITVKDLFLFSGLRLDPDNYKIEHTKHNVAAYLNRLNAPQRKDCGVTTKPTSVSLGVQINKRKIKGKLSYLVNPRTITSFSLGLCLGYAYTTYRHNICTFAKNCWQWLSNKL